MRKRNDEQCSNLECRRPARSKGLCSKHYQAARRVAAGSKRVKAETSPREAREEMAPLPEGLQEAWREHNTLCNILGRDPDRSLTAVISSWNETVKGKLARVEI